jgi:signal transduction histidine kinase
VETQPDRFLIADVAALTGVPVPQLRSWERAGLLCPAHSARGVRVYGVEDVARARLIKRSLVNPGRRGSLRRLAQRLASGELLPGPSDYAGLEGPRAAPTEALVGVGWRAVFDALADFVAVADRDGAVAYVNPALRAALGLGDGWPRPSGPRAPDVGSPAGALFDADGLLLGWTARTGAPQRDVRAVLRGADGAERQTLWQTTALPGRDGFPAGAVAVGRDVTAERALAQAQEDQLASAAHDLRAPIATVLGHLQLARRVVAAEGQAQVQTDALPTSLLEEADAASLASPPGPARYARLARHLEMAESGTRDLLRSMETLLDASAAASGGLAQRLDAAPVDLNEVVRQAVDQVRLLTTRHRVTQSHPAERLVVVGDGARLREVLDNLLSNAVKYSPDGGPIDVELEAAADASAFGARQEALGAPGWAVIRVADAGIGVPAADVHRVFDRYWRGELAARSVRGTGLGLYTSRAIVAAHGGHIWVERTAVASETTSGRADTDEGNAGWHGTVMAVALPLAPREGR